MDHIISLLMLILQHDRGEDALRKHMRPLVIAGQVLLGLYVPSEESLRDLLEDLGKFISEVAWMWPVEHMGLVASDMAHIIQQILDKCC